jgi:hypothetical protein
MATAYPITEEIEKSIERHTTEILLFNSLVSISSLHAEDFPLDRQKVAKVLLRDVKDKIRNLRSMLWFQI